jgi:hypothetical protein
LDFGCAGVFSGFDFCHLLELDDVFHCLLQHRFLFGDQLVWADGPGVFPVHAPPSCRAVPSGCPGLGPQEARMTQAPNVAMLSKVTEQLLISAGKPILYVTLSDGRNLELTPSEAADAAGMLPAFLMAADAIWQETLGEGFGVKLARDINALAGWRLESVEGSFSATVLAVMEAMYQASGPDWIFISELVGIWEETMARVHENQAHKGQGQA